jgi:hypothetical protein
LEGNGEKWDSFIKNSGCFRGFSPPILKNQNGFQNVQQLKNKRSFLLDPSCKFFFLGDAVDKGNDTIRILRDFVYLKEAFPYNVWLIPGNREINKMRWLQEISKEGRLVPDNFYKFTRSKFPPQNAKGLIAQKDFTKLFSDYFGGTFGAPKAMELRSQELGVDSLRSSNYNEWITTILKSLREDVETYKDVSTQKMGGGPSRGLLRRFLELSEMVVRHNDILLSHGYIGPDSLGKVPRIGGGHNDFNTQNITGIDRWINELNKFKDKNMRILIEKGHYGVEQKKANNRGISHAKFAGNDLILYQEPLLDGKYSFNQNSVVLGRNSNGGDFGNAFDISIGSHGATTKELSNAGINIRISGHTPTGQSSFIQKASIPTRPVSWNINVDNSSEHSRMKGVTNIFKIRNNSQFYSSSTIKLSNGADRFLRAIFNKNGNDSEIGERYECNNLAYTVIGKSGANHILYRGEAKYKTNNIEANLQECKKITGLK